MHDNLLPVLEIDLDLPIWVWDTIFALGLFAVLYFGVQISTRVQLTLALISIAVVLIFFITVIADLGSDNDVAKAFDPSPGRWVQRDPVRGAVRGADLRRVRDGGEPRRGDGRARSARSHGRCSAPWSIVSVFYLIAAYVEVAGFGFDLVGDHEPGGGRRTAVRARRSGEPAGSEFWLKILLAGRVPRHAGGLRRGGGGVDPRRVRDGSRPAAAGDARLGVEALRDAGGRDRAADGRSRRS